ncbi:MAG: hypothetical protein JW751_12105 [Polyangiaceae bacterium]|nr:hypothetical protein [Polyangiaceae bacterium]
MRASWPGILGEALAPSIGELEAAVVHRLAKDAILLEHVVEEALRVAVRPTGGGQEREAEELPRVATQRFAWELGSV